MCHKSSMNCVLLITFGLTLYHSTPGDAITGEVNIRKIISRNIQLGSKPVEAIDEKVPVILGINPIHVNAVDEVNGVLTITVWISQRWNSKFTWETSSFGDLDKLIFKGRGQDFEMWHPDITLISSVGEDNYLPSKLDKEYIMSNDGEVLWWSQTTLKSPCLFNSSAVRCDLIFASWRHSNAEIDIKIPHKEIKSDYLKYYHPTGLWQIDEVDFTKGESYYPCCSEPYPNIVFSLYLNKSEEIASRLEAKQRTIVEHYNSNGVKVSPMFLPFTIFNLIVYRCFA